VRRRLALTLVSLLLLAAAACGGGEGTDASDDASAVDMGEEIAGVEVTGEVGEEPEVNIDAPLELDETTSQVVVAGDGDEAVQGEDALLHLYVANGTTGKKAVASYDQGTPAALKLSEDQLFPALVDAIAGKPVGSRVAVAATPEDAYGTTGAEQLGIGAEDSVLFVVDVISVKPTDVLEEPSGDEAEAAAGLPTIEETGGNITGLSFDDVPKQPEAGVDLVTLVEGGGEPIRDQSLVTMDYIGQVYGADAPFNNSYTEEPATFGVGTGGLIPAWDSALVGVKTGSRVLLSVPPEDGYGPEGNPSIDVKGDDTMVFLIDVLGVG